MNTFQKGIASLALTSGILGCTPKPELDTIELMNQKRSDIISTMNAEIVIGGKTLPKSKNCNILIVGTEKLIQAALVCDDTTIIDKTFPKRNISVFKTGIFRIEALDTIKLNPKSGCMLMEEEGITLMNPPRCMDTENKHQVKDHIHT